jgi:hypothetical protein
MYFADHTTPYEQSKGSIAHDVLLDRYLDAGADFLQPPGLSAGEVHASLAVGDRIYELEIEVSAINPAATAIFWQAYDTVDREAAGGETVYLRGEQIPLDLPNLVNSLCRTFKLDREQVLESAVDLQHYWSEYEDDEHMKIPRDEDKARHLLKNLHKFPA